MPFVESRRACHSRSCYRPHAHPTFSIGAVDQGVSVFSGVPGGDVVLTPGTLVFVPPMRVHACNPEPGQTWSYQMLHIDAQWLNAIRQEDAGALNDDGVDAPVRVTRDPSLYLRFCDLNKTLFSGLSCPEKEATLIEFVCDYDDAAGERIAAPHYSVLHRRKLAPLLNRLRENLAEAPALGSLAAMAGMSRFQLIRAFRAATGMTPHAWQVNQRVHLARDRLQAGGELADIANHLGFADQSHFQRVFKAYTGVTPGGYRI